MDTPLKQLIQEHMKAAMRAQDKPRLGVIRMILAAIKQVEVDERIELDNTQICQVLNKMLKQRRAAIAQYSQAKRDDLVAQERYEESVIQTYLPRPLSEAELDQLLTKTIKEVGATSVKDMAKVVAEIKQKYESRVDIAILSAKLKQRLS
jgi:uncharacterized protein